MFIRLFFVYFVTIIFPLNIFALEDEGQVNIEVSSPAVEENIDDSSFEQNAWQDIATDFKDELDAADKDSSDNNILSEDSAQKPDYKEEFEADLENTKEFSNENQITQDSEDADVEINSIKNTENQELQGVEAELAKFLVFNTREIFDKNWLNSIDIILTNDQQLQNSHPEERVTKIEPNTEQAQSIAELEERKSNDIENNLGILEQTDENPAQAKPKENDPYVENKFDITTIQKSSQKQSEEFATANDFFLPDETHEYNSEPANKKVEEALPDLPIEFPIVNNSNEDKETGSLEATSAEQLKFVQDEAIVLTLEQDDVVLGELSINAKLTMLNSDQYVRIFEKYNEYNINLNRSNKIDKFIENYDENYNPNHQFLIK